MDIAIVAYKREVSEKDIIARMEENLSEERRASKKRGFKTKIDESHERARKESYMEVAAKAAGTSYECFIFLDELPSQKNGYRVEALCRIRTGKNSRFSSLLKPLDEYFCIERRTNKLSITVLPPQENIDMLTGPEFGTIRQITKQQYNKLVEVASKYT
jgi:hypothetical protein